MSTIYDAPIDNKDILEGSPVLDNKEIATGITNSGSSQEVINNNNNNNSNGAAGAVGPAQQPRPIPYVGLVNPSCICYLNSLIQSLYHTPAFRAAVFQVDTKDDDIDDSIPKALQNLFFSLGNAKDGEPQNTRQLTESFGWGPRDLAIQHDIQELFTKLREAIDTRVQGKVDILFTTFSENYISCLDGSYDSAKPAREHELILPVQGQQSIDTALDGHCAIDRLVDGNKYKVEYDDGRKPEYKDAEKGYRFNRFAPVLFVHLKRFEYDYTSENFDLKKINTTWQFPKHLNLSARENGKFITPADVKAAADRGDIDMKQAYEIGMKQQEAFPEVYGQDAEFPAAEYELYCVLVHSGNVQYGHYTCNIRDIDVVDPTTNESTLSDRWYNYDDHVISEIAEENAIDKNWGGYTYVRGQQVLSSKNAYMLAYVRKACISKIFKNDDPSGIKTLPEIVRKEFGKKLEEEMRLQRIEAQKNQMCHIIVINDQIIAENVQNRQVELIELGDSVSKTAPAISIFKNGTIKELYDGVSSLMNGAPTEDFRLHWFIPLGHHDSRFRVGGTIIYNKDTANDTIESIAPRSVQLPERPWMFKLYVEPKKIQVAPHLTNAARGAEFIPSSLSHPDGLKTMEEASPAYPFCDNRMFQFDPKDVIAPKVEVRLKKKFHIENIAFQCPLPKEHHSNYACTRFDVKISMFNDDKLVHTHVVHHQNHTDHSVLYNDSRFVGVQGAEGPFLANRVLFERVNVSIYDQYYPNQRTDPANADQWIMSRLKIQVQPGEIDPYTPFYTEPRFITDDIRSFYVAVKYYSYRTCKMEFKGFLSIPIAEFFESNTPVLRSICGLDQNTRIRIYEELSGYGADQIDLGRKCWSPKKNGDVVEQILIVQEEPPASSFFMFELPLVPGYLRSISGTRTVMLCSFKNPEEGGVGVVHVPDYATHDMVCEEVGKALNVPWDRIRLYGCRDYGSSSNGNLPLPKPEPFRSDESNVNNMLPHNRREGVLFFDVLKCSLKEAESVMEVTCFYADQLGSRISPEPFSQQVSVSVSMIDLAEMIAEHFGVPFESCHAFVDVQSNMIENYALVVPAAAEKRGAAPATIAGAEGSNSKGVSNKMTIDKFFRSFENRYFELRPFPEADSVSQVYVLAHGEYYPNGYPSVSTTNRTENKPPGFVSIPITADVNDGYKIVMEAYQMKDEDFQDDPKNHAVMLYIHSALHFPNWETKLKDYFFHNPSQFNRPKAMLVNHKHDKERPRHTSSSNNYHSNQPVLSLTKKQNKNKEEKEKDDKTSPAK